MSEKEGLFKAAIHYYGFGGFPKLMENAATEGLRIFTNNVKLRFYHAVSLLLQGKLQEALRELEPLQDDSSLGVATLLALIHTHKACKTVDREEVSKWDSKLKEKRKQMNENSLYFGCVFLVLVRKFEKAREYCDKLQKVASNLGEKSSICGWLEIMSSLDNVQVSPSVGEFFDPGIRANDPDSILGKVKFYQLIGSFFQGIELLNNFIVRNSNFLPSLIEKMKLQVGLKEWDQAVETAQTALALDRHCIEAQRYIIIYELAWTGNEKIAVQKIGDLTSSIEIRERKNTSFLMETAKILHRLGCSHKAILSQACSISEKAVLFEPNNVDYLIELGNQCISMDRLMDARRHFNTALKCSESNIEAAIGLLHCSIIEDPIKATEQIEAMEELHKSTGIEKKLLYLSALWSHKTEMDCERAGQYLEDIIDSHRNSIKALPLSLKFYIQLNPEFIIKVLKLLIESVPYEPVVKGQIVEPRLQKSKEMIQTIISNCPGLREPLFLMAQVQNLSGDSKSALCYLGKMEDRGENVTDWLILRAKILVTNRSYQEASNTLELALGQNFEIRERYDYIILKAQIHRFKSEYDEALKCLQDLMANSKLSSSQALSKNQKVDVLLEMAKIYLHKNEINTAENILEDLLSQHHDSTFESKILIAKASLSEFRGRIEEAISTLREIPSHNKSDFIKSREIMAHLYLKHRKDRRLYISCYKEILEKNNGTHSYLTLGDAYMNILEPEKAIESYEQALKKKPSEGLLIRRVGQALIKAHLFEKAITYYKAALRSSPDHELRYDLSLLLFRLKRLGEAEKIVRQALEIIANQGTQDLDLMHWEAKMIHLFSQIQQASGNKDQGIETLQKAQQVFLRVYSRICVERPDSESQVKKAVTRVSLTLAQHYENHLRDKGKAIEIYKKILVFDPDNITVLMALERLEIAQNNLEEARKYSSLVLKNAPSDRESLLMTTDLMFRRGDFEGALSHVKQVMEGLPCFYLALARLVEAARRTGKLDTAKQFIDKAGDFSSRSESESGYNYCRGLYQWYRGELNEAMKCFNKSSSDRDFGLMASYHMIEIFITSESDAISSLSLESHNSNSELVGAQEAAFRTSQKILLDIEPVAGEDLDYRIMKNLVLLYRRLKSDADQVLGEFIRILNDPRYPDHPGALLGLASAYLVLKQVPKARSHLKKAMKMEWNYSTAEYLEKCWILLADIYIQAGKYESAQELLRKVITYNKSNVKAYGFFGFIFDKTANYKEAIINYEIVWRLQNSNNPVIGFKLALDYMKCKRYVDAIDVGRSILAKIPEYPRIQKEIIEKCRNHLKN